jgi:hypothetical protein
MTEISSGWQWFDAPESRELRDAESDPDVVIAFARCFDSRDGDRGFSICVASRSNGRSALGHPMRSFAISRGNGSWSRTSWP